MLAPRVGTYPALRLQLRLRIMAWKEAQCLLALHISERTQPVVVFAETNFRTPVALLLIDTCRDTRVPAWLSLEKRLNGDAYRSTIEKEGSNTTASEYLMYPLNPIVCLEGKIGPNTKPCSRVLFPTLTYSTRAGLRVRLIRKCDLINEFHKIWQVR